jgi:hypothetical protein
MAKKKSNKEKRQRKRNAGNGISLCNNGSSGKQTCRRQQPAYNQQYRTLPLSITTAKQAAATGNGESKRIK